MRKGFDALSTEEKIRLVQEIRQKKIGLLDKDWITLCEEYELDMSAETLRKAGVGVQMAEEAGMLSSSSYQEAIAGKYDADKIERQKIRDVGNKLNALTRSEARSQLLRETVYAAIKQVAKENPIKIPSCNIPMLHTEKHKELVVCLGDFHYGADINIQGLHGETMNLYNSEEFETRMNLLKDEIIQIAEREHVSLMNLFLVGDLIDGMLRQSQLMRLEFGLVESVVRLSEFLAQWINELSNYGCVKVVGCTGNHSEIRPLGSKAREFMDENLEKIIFWYLHDRLENNQRVEVDAKCDKMKLAKVCGYSFVLLHGDAAKSIQDIARSSINVYGEPIDFFVCGHLHSEQEIPTGVTPDGNSVIIRTPSLCGLDKYALSKGYGGRAGATAILMEDGYGRRCMYPIRLQ